MFSVPDSVVVRRPFTLNGAKVPAGTSLTKEQVIAIGRELNALLDNGTLVAKPDPHARRDKQPQPTSLPPVVRNAMVAKLKPAAAPLSIKATPVGLKVSVSITGGLTPWNFAWGDGKSSKVTTRTASHDYAADGTFTITCEDGSGQTATASVTVKDPNPPEKGKK